MTQNRITPRQAKAIVAIIGAKTIEHGLASVKVGRTTFYAWMKNPVFAEAYRQQRQRIIQEAYSTLERHLDTAGKTLVLLLASPDEKTKLRAAIAIIELHSKHVETAELAERIQKLELQINER